MRRLVPAVVAVAAAIVVAVVVSGGGDDRYTIKLRLANAGGLRDDSPVVNGGVPIGVVKLDAHRDYVDAELRIDKQYAPIGKDAAAGIIAQNVIGQKQVRVELGDRRDPAPDGYTLPAKQVRETTDLDQLLSTFDPDTRTRLAILINETGSAFAGRKMDFNSFLRDFAPALNSGGEVLNRLTRDNRALTSLVGTSDGFIAELAAQRRRFARVLDNAGRTAETVATRRADLRAALRRAPGALHSARAFLAELRDTTQPLGETARLLTRTSPSLAGVLGEIGPFERDAGPTIRGFEPIGVTAARTGSRVGPMLTRLLPTTGDLKALSQNETVDVGKALDGSVDNVVAAVDNWAHAIQFRDGLGHVFRGEFSIAPDAIDSLIRRLIPPSERKRAKEPKRRPLVPSLPRPATPKPDKPAINPPKVDVPVLPTVKKIIDDVLGSATGQPPKGEEDGGTKLLPLLDYLMGSGR